MPRSTSRVRIATRGTVRRVLGAVAATGLGVLALWRVGTYEAPGAAGRDLSDAASPAELPAIPSFCDASFDGTRARIRAISNATQDFNDALTLTGDVSCFRDWTDYSSYPQDPPDPCTAGGVIFFVIGLFYMFMGLAVVCDEFFVPALEVMVEKFSLSNDVAGATLMAAGGSAPELFTSLIGTFLSRSNVGFGTIVGSAVFNVLFVIGMCAIFSKDVLELTWWPLARDSSYYAMSLSVLAIFYGNGGKESGQILWWEAAVLLMLYAGYVILMKNNDKLQLKVRSALGLNTKVNPEHGPNGPSGPSESEIRSSARRASNPFLFHNQFRAGLIHLMVRESNMLDQNKLRIVMEIKGDAKETFRRIDSNNSGHIESFELAQVLKELTGTEVDDEAVRKIFEDLGSTVEKGLDLPTFTEWYMQSEHRVMAEAKRNFDIMDKNDDGKLDREEIKSVIEAMRAEHGHNDVTDDELEEVMRQFEKQGQDSLNYEEFVTWYKKSMLWQRILEDVSDGDDDDGGPLELEWPESTRGRINFVLTAPIVIPLWLTIPDVRRDGREKYYPVTWCMSIAWIAFYSYFMVWWAMLLGDAAGLAPSVMGVTFLAAGTSIPDLITSVIVARQGYGDMAVSSSIGSNIFDILIGLPVPWLLYNIIYQEPVVVTGDDLLISVLVLIGMLVAVIITIAVNKWRMTKTLGVTMFGLYIVFVAQDVWRQLAPCS